jgi:hypothetical protein
MTSQPNFQPSVREPLIRGDITGVAVELEFDGAVPGLAGDTIMLYCRDDATIEQARMLRDLLKKIVIEVKVTNPHRGNGN